MIDLHVHSTASDGTLTPAELAAKAQRFYAVALTDHDNTNGVEEFAKNWQGAGHFFAGVELSVQPGEGYHRFHLLGLGVNPECPQLRELLADVLRGREERNKLILARLQSLGLQIDEVAVRQFVHGPIMARPHIARALVAAHAAENIGDAFKRYLQDGAPAYVPRYRPEPAAAIAAIHAAGGVAVMAHPRYWTEDEARLRRGLQHLKDSAGLDGLEVVYQANLPEHTVMSWRVAEALQLAKTAGSDFHGANKPKIPLGMEMLAEEDFLAPFMECYAHWHKEVNNV